MEIVRYYHADIKTKEVLYFYSEETFVWKELINIQDSPYTNISDKCKTK
jgi:hypothetical protein